MSKIQGDGIVAETLFSICLQKYWSVCGVDVSIFYLTLKESTSPFARGAISGVLQRHAAFSKLIANMQKNTAKSSAHLNALDTPPRPQGAWHPSDRGEVHNFCAFDFTSGSAFNFAFKEVPNNFKLLARANELRKAKYLHEAKLWKKLNRAQMCGLNFHRQQVIGNYIVDFVCYKIGLIIEADGASHRGKEEYDKNRDNYLKALGFTILHIPVKGG